MRFKSPLVLSGSTARAIAQFASVDEGRPTLRHVAVWFPHGDDVWVMAATDSWSYVVVSNAPRGTSELIGVASTQPDHLLSPGVVKAMGRTRKVTADLVISSPAVLREGDWRLRTRWAGGQTSQWPANLNKLWAPPKAGLHVGATLAATTLAKIARFVELTGATIEMMGSARDPQASPFAWRTMPSNSSRISAFGVSMPVRVV